MKNFLQQLRADYFQQIIAANVSSNFQFVVLTHLLNDQPVLFEAIETVAPISLIIGIPYSNSPKVVTELREKYNVSTPTLQELYDKNFLKKTINKYILPDKPVVILEIGGYFAKILHDLSGELGDRLLGVIEDTENGHREYELLDDIPCPIISVARSKLKAAEDFLVGPSCIYSTEKLMRKAGFPLEGKKSLVLGFGKVGRGVAHALMRRHCPASVFDIDPIKRVRAISEGFVAPNKTQALKNASIIYGATGKMAITKADFNNLRNGAILVSCSSKDVEFDLEYLSKNYNKQPVLKQNFDRYEKDGHVLYLLSEGKPVNFIDGSVIGPILALVQSEILLAIQKLLTLKGKSGLFELDIADQRLLAKIWLQNFCDESLGHYKHV